jgi:hypothetical protein
MRAGLANANGRIVRALQARLGLAGGTESAAVLLYDAADIRADPFRPPTMVIEELREEPWASLTFTGTRHHVELRLDGHAQALADAIEALAKWSEDADPLPGGHFLAEVQVMETAREVGEGGRMALSLRLDALTIEE